MSRFVEEDVQGVAGVDGLVGAWGITVAPDGGSVYATGDASHSVAVFDRDPGTGALTYVEAEKDGVGGVDGLLNSTGVAVSPDGKHVYATGCADNGVATFSRDASTSALTFVEDDESGDPGVTGLGCARGVSVSADGKHVVVAGESDDSVVTFSRDAGQEPSPGSPRSRTGSGRSTGSMASGMSPTPRTALRSTPPASWTTPWRRSPGTARAAR